VCFDQLIVELQGLDGIFFSLRIDILGRYGAIRGLDNISIGKGGISRGIIRISFDDLA
jgi:hypothetical protein